MTDKIAWIKKNVSLGWALVGVGLLIMVVGIVLNISLRDWPFNIRIVTGAGILLFGVGAGMVVKYKAMLKNDPKAQRLVAEELDERSRAIRMQAGFWAYGVSTALVFIGLMWAGWAANGMLPPLQDDTLWYALVVALVVPFLVYIGGILLGERQN